MQHAGSQFPQLGIKVMPPAEGAWNSNHWTTREVLRSPLLSRIRRNLKTPFPEKLHTQVCRWGLGEAKTPPIQHFF